MSELENTFEFEMSDKDLPSFEIIKYLEKRIKEKSDEYEVILKQKDETIKKLNNRIVELERFIEELKSTKSKKEEEILSQNKELISKVEESKNILLKQKEKHQKEISLLKEIFEKTRLDLEELSKELDELKKEKLYLKTRNIELEQEKTKIEAKIDLLQKQLSQSKEAVEKTVSELLNERKRTEDLSKKIRELQKQNEDLQKQLESTKLAWDSERAQWKEMWERERSLWESHRMEFAVWEERLRNEREAWLRILKEEEAKGIENAKKLAEVLEESSKWSYKVGELLKLYANKEIVLPQIITSTKTIKDKINKGFRRTLLFINFALVGLIGSFYMYYEYANKLHLFKTFSNILDDNQYSSFAIYDDGYIFSHLQKGLIIKDKDFKNIEIINEVENRLIKPSFVYVEGDYVWFFDLSSLRFVKMDFVERKVVSSIKSLTYAPQGFFSDGSYLWVFDGIGGVLQRYELNGGVKSVKTYELANIKTVDSITWLDDNLLVLSNSKLYRFKMEGDRFIKKSVQKVPNFVYCYLYKEELFALIDMFSVKKLEIYKIKNKERL